MPERRGLAFSSLDEVMPEVDRLLAGHTTAGGWSLGQICNHLNRAITYSVDGYPKQMPWPVRRLAGPLLWWRLRSTGTIPAGIKGPPYLQPKPDLDDRAEAEALRAALALFARKDPIVEHPFFGRMNRTDWERLHCIHCAHHLSFAVPTGSGH